MGSTKPPSQSPFRWIVLIMLIVLVFSMVYCYDQLFALQNQLMDTYSLSPLQYNMLYSIYGYVNVILPLISGILIDYIGINATSVLFYSLIIIGQSIWIFACVIGSYPVMVLGRGIFVCIWTNNICIACSLSHCFFCICTNLYCIQFNLCFAHWTNSNLLQLHFFTLFCMF